MEFRDEVLLAPLTKGGNLPFRRLCVDFGARITMSEMAYSRQVVRKSRSELALLRKHECETAFGVQIAANKPDEAVAAAQEAVRCGASFVDLNCGCPIHDTVKRGMGASLLKKPNALQRVVEGMARDLDVPVTVKIRTGWQEGKENARDVALRVQDAGAVALCIHGRTREQRYTRSANWDVVAQLVEELDIPVIGNGDLYTWYEVEDRRAQSGCAAVMLARGALIKPWLFREVAEGREWVPTVPERIEVYQRLASYMKEHFRDDDRGRQRAMRFLPWHLGLFCRWRSWPEAEHREASREHPILQTRANARTDWSEPLEALLADSREEVHQALADLLWDAADADDALTRARALTETMPPEQSDASGEMATSHG